MKLDPDEIDAISGMFFEREGREPSFDEIEREFAERYAYVVDSMRDRAREEGYAAS